MTKNKLGDRIFNGERYNFIGFDISIDGYHDNLKGLTRGLGHVRIIKREGKPSAIYAREEQ
jgi:hypothetical protein